MRKRKPDYIQAFIDSVQALSLEETVAQTTAKLEEIKDQLKELKYSHDHEELAMMMNFHRDIKALLHFLTTKQPPEQISHKRFQRFRWLTEKLVLKKELPEEVLNLFDAVD